MKNGFDAITILGWATVPYYYKEKNILQWAKEAKFGESETNTLNYNVRILGRKGVLVLNAIAAMNDLPLVQKEIPNVLNIIQFNEGFQYRDFEPGV